MTVLIDCRFADTPTGLGRYTRELTKALLRRNDPLSYRLLVRTDPVWLEGLQADVLVADIPHYSFAEQHVLPGIIAKSGASLFYAHHFNVPWRCPIPFVATVHDLILHHYPNASSVFKRAAYSVLMHRTVRKASHVFTISEFVKEELATAYGSALLQKTEVLHEGVARAFIPQPLERVEQVRRKFGCEKPYFLYVGNCKEHKNVQTLIDAFAASGADAELVLVTGGPEVQTLRMLSEVRVLLNVPDEDLACLYTGAVATVTASLYEGFGLPVLEALHCGCPVIASNRTALPESGCGLATLTEPTLGDFREAFLHPPLGRVALAERHTWETTAREAALSLSQLTGVTGRL